MAEINLGLAAADQYFKADDQRVLREQQRQQFDWNKQRTEAELSTLPERTEATRTGAKLQTANNQSELAIAPNKALVNKALSEYAVEDLPGALADMRRKRALSDVDAQVAGVAKLADLIQIGDPAQVVNYLNAWRKADPSRMPADVAQVGFQKDPKSGENVFMAMDSQGNPIMQLSASQIQRVRDSVGKADVKVLKPGDTLVTTKNGRTTPGFTAPVNPDLIKGLRGQNTPAEIQTMEWLIKNKVAKDQASAWEMVRSSKEKTKNAFILDYVGKNTLPGQDPNKLSEQAGQLYDRLRGGTGNTSGGQSNTSAPTTLDPRLNSLLGLPSE